MQVEATSSDPTRGTLDELLEAALRSFIEQTSSVGKAKPGTLVQRVAAELELKAGIFTLRDIQHPTRERLIAAVRDIWLKGLSTRSKYPADMITSVTHHILRSLPEGTACASSSLAKQLAEFGFKIKPDELNAFVDEGVMAGFLLRYDRRKAEPLFRVADDEPLLVSNDVKLTPSSTGGCVAHPSSAFLLCRRFTSEVRALDQQYLACPSGKLEEVVAFAKKEGFVARRTS